MKTIKEFYTTLDELKYMRSEIQNMQYAYLINSNQSILNVKKRRGGYLLEDSRPLGIVKFSPIRSANSTPERRSVYNTQNRTRGRQSSSPIPLSSTSQDNNICDAPSMQAKTNHSHADTLNGECQSPDRFTTELQQSATASHTVTIANDDPIRKNKYFAEVLLQEN